MASNDSLLIWEAEMGTPPASSYANIYSRNPTDPHYVLAYGDSVDVYRIFTGIMPLNYDGGGVTLYLHYAMATAIAGEVIWQAAFERIGNEQQDIDSSGFGSYKQTSALTVPTTAGLVDIVSLSFSSGAEMDNVAEGEGFRIKLGRYGTHGDDDASGDAHLWMIEMRES